MSSQPSPQRARQVVFGTGPVSREFAEITDEDILCDFARTYYADAGGNLNIANIPSMEIWNEANRILRINTTCPRPSPFKKASAFTLAFCENAPIVTSMRGSKVTPEILEIANHQNILIAVEFCLFILHGAEIEHDKRGTLEIKNPLKVSAHYMADLVHAISCGHDGFHWLTLIYEAITYKTNPEFEDPE